MSPRYLLSGAQGLRKTAGMNIRGQSQLFAVLPAKQTWGVAVLLLLLWVEKLVLYTWDCVVTGSSMLLVGTWRALRMLGCLQHPAASAAAHRL
jgi:hypothetical protein